MGTMDSTSHAQQPAAEPQRNQRHVPVKECLGMGCVAAALVLVMTFIFTHAYESSKAMMLVLLYTAITFVAVSGISVLLNWIAGGEKPRDPSKPVLD